MAVCDVCGNHYAHTFQVVLVDGAQFTFDSIECAAQKIAPICAHCHCRILGHGIEGPDGIYCCAHCARSAGATTAVDNTTKAAARG